MKNSHLSLQMIINKIKIIIIAIKHETFHARTIFPEFATCTYSLSFHYTTRNHNFLLICNKMPNPGWFYQVFSWSHSKPVNVFHLQVLVNGQVKGTGYVAIHKHGTDWIQFAGTVRCVRDRVCNVRLGYMQLHFCIGFVLYLLLTQLETGRARTCGKV